MNYRIYAAVLAALGLSASPVMADKYEGKPLLSQGTQEISVAGRLEFPDFDRLDYDLDGSYGYFVRDGWEVGARVGASDFGGVDRVDLGVFTEYNFNRDQMWVPYVGVAVGIGAVSFDDGDFSSSTELNDDEGVIFDIEAGVKWFLRSNFAISTAINFQFATEDVYATDDEIEDNITTLQIGMRYYY